MGLERLSIDRRSRVKSFAVMRARTTFRDFGRRGLRGVPLYSRDMGLD
jgi:hypothetical protein